MEKELTIKVPFWGKNYMFYVYSALLGLFGGLGLWCLLNILAMGAFSDSVTYPISGSAYSLLGLFSLFFCLIISYFYLNSFKHLRKRIQIIAHVLTVIACFCVGVPFSMFMDNFLRSILEPLIK